MARNYKELHVWQKSIDFAVVIYEATENFPKSELYGLTSQMRRSAVSIASNIAEGSERRSDKDFIRFLNIASASLAELETQIIIAQKLKFLTKDTMEHLLLPASEIGKMLNRLCNKLAIHQVETGDRRLETLNA